MKKKVAIFFTLIFLMHILAMGQEKDQQVFLTGYIKNLNEFSFVDRLDELQWTSLLHNRLNFKFTPSPTLKFRLEIRNRIFYGDKVKKIVGFSDALANDKGLVDMSWNSIDGNTLVLNTTIDRMLLNFIKGNWDITLGRQRINWGVNLIWNPNDIFNTYNFLDFDYEERPGSDAIRIQYYLDDFRRIEVAAKKGNEKDDHIVSAMYKFNTWSYDIQFLTGVYQKDWVFGAGWAGNIKNAGCKGEISYFIPIEMYELSKNILSTSVSLDYAFKKGLYIQGSFLYNTSTEEETSLENLIYNSITAKNLMPFTSSWFLQFSKEFSPIFTGTINTIYSSTNQSLIVMPSLNYSLATNWELNVTSQSFFELERSRTLGNSFFVRLRWSY